MAWLLFYVFENELVTFKFKQASFIISVHPQSKF